MEEIEVKNNPLGIKVYVSEKPDIKKMPKEELDLFISSLEVQISEYYSK